MLNQDHLKIMKLSDGWKIKEKMTINYKEYEIELIDDNNHPVKSNDKYKYEYFDGKIIKNRIFPMNKRGIFIRSTNNKSKISSAVLCENGGRTTIAESVFQIEDEKIWVCVGDKVYCLKIPTLQIEWHAYFNNGVNFSVHQFQEDLLIHGELGLIRISTDGTLKWRYEGSGIFISRKDNIKIEGNTIELIDGNNDKYIIDEFGNEL